MHILILAHLDDIGAQKVAARLRARLGRQEVAIIPAEALAMAPRIAYTLDGHAGQSSKAGNLSVQLAGGDELETTGLHTVLNRLRDCDAPQFFTAAQADKEYANAELSALWVSWLYGLQAQGIRVVNPPSRGAFQPGYSQLEWLRLASQAGLPVADFYSDRPAETMALKRFLAAGDISAPLAVATPGSVESSISPDNRLDADELSIAGFTRENIHRLQTLSRCPLIELSIARVDDTRAAGYMVSQVNPFPVLLEAAAMDAVATFLAND